MESRSESSQKAVRINIRASERQKSVLRRAAKLRRTTMSDFVLENAVKAAEDVIAQQKLADRTHFALTKPQWEAFCAALDAPSRPKDALKRLMTERGMFDAR
ncbi:MAG: DUF1778 domain-containing protein [Blastocatellia bacterium AA13]|nr:MAG: DUF1778 domain-containing protein [Blastocatellia bacterium AA13]